MIRSMTGYGAATLEAGAVRAAGSVRSLNHRFLDVALHVPRRLQSLEPEVRERVARDIKRGRVEVVVQAVVTGGDGEGVLPSRALVSALVRALRELQAEFGLDGGVSVSDVLRFPGALERIETAGDIAAAVREQVLDLLGSALAKLDEMRGAEGSRLKAELARALDVIEAATARIETRSAQSREERRGALRERVLVLIADLGLDDARLYQEAVRAVERHDVAEEVARLRSHVTGARSLVLDGDGEAAGKRLDFLAQELMREANTVGSKVQDAAAVEEVVALKAEIERFREQVQNVE
jgi:uncharacterized protein (TIGR00255 family)